jgi:thiol-disulfide isomerase/thioredoxin
MNSLTPRPVLLALATLLIIGAIVFIEFRFGRAGSDDTQAQIDPTPAAQTSEPVAEPDPEIEDKVASGKAEREGAAERITRKEAEFPRANEIIAPTGFINTEGVSIGENLGEKVVLLEFWTYSCFNCQNVQPYLNQWHEEYEDDGLLVIGVHRPEFEFEKDPASVQTAVEEADIRYPVVLDNNSATWDAYDNRYWPARYLIDADGFIRYQHFGEGAYEENEEEIQKLLKEKDQVLSL